MSKLFYLASPYTGTKEEVESRMELLCKSDAKLMKAGYLTVSPLLKHYIIHHESLPGDWAYWKEYSEELLIHCRGMIVVMTEGWRNSTGVLAEIAFCISNGIEVLYFDPYKMAFD